MLSRCRQSMLICSSQKYLSNPKVRDTLVGDVSHCICILAIQLMFLYSLHQGVKLSTRKSHGSVGKILRNGCGSGRVAWWRCRLSTRDWVVHNSGEINKKIVGEMMDRHSIAQAVSM